MNATLMQPARELKSLGFSDVRDILDNMRDETDDFECENHRFINDNSIDGIMRDELSGDPYVLGCFNAWFLADILGIDTEAVEDIQKAEAFVALGKMVLAGKLDALQSAYVSADGYGHHFAHYDFEESEVGKYHIFRIN